MIRIGTDLDDTVNVWYSEYLKRFGQPKDSYEITRNVQRVLSKDREFWLNLPIKHTIDFEVTLYCTKRVNPKSWTKAWLDKNLYPKAPVYQVFTQGANKAKYIKGLVDVFIEDSVPNFIQINLSGIPCLLIDSPEDKQNQDWGPVGRIFSLNKDEIEGTYGLLLETGMFHNFNKLL